jgi:uncharacterized protein YkwD
VLALVTGSWVCAVPASAAPATTPAPKHATRIALSTLEAGVLQQLNAIRVQHRLAPLAISAALSASAAQHTQEMASDGYFAHNSHDGTAFWKRIQQWYPQGSAHYWAVGENLVWSSPDLDAPGALKLWMGSPEHRANILDPRWRDLGVAALHVDAAPGVYQGLGVTIITTDFGVRK